jgi:hypothetical protein
VKFNRHINKNIKRFLIFIMPIFMISLTIITTEHQSQAEEETVVTPKYTPTKDPTKFIGIWLTSGYSLQPKENYYTTVNNSVTIKTNTGRSVWTLLTGIFDSASYQWWESTDGKTWSKISKSNGGQKKNLVVTPKETGSIWYQLDTQYAFLGINKKHLYSKVGAIHALPEPVNATKVEVSVDDDYLYNTSDNLSNTTYAHATPTPANATGTVDWSVDDESLATVDSEGLVTANNQDKTGTVHVIATMTNPDGTKFQGSAPVEIGGGLEDKTVKSGETATFTLKGNTGGDGDDEENNGSVTIDWYRYDPNTGQRTKVESNGGTSYTTPDTTYADNGSFYQAVITLKVNLITKTITTNKAKLTVIPSGDPDIELTNQLTNQTFTTKDNDEHNLYDVVNSDNIVYHDTLKNNSNDGLLKNGFYVIPMHTGTTINSIKVNDQKLDDDKFSIIHNDEDDTDDLVIELDTLNIQEVATIDVDTTVKNATQKESRSYIPYIYGTNNDDNVYRKDGAVETISYTTNSLDANIKDIDFGTIKAFSKGTLQHRPSAMNSPNNIIDTSDQRRDKGGLKVFVSQLNEFTDDNSEVLPVSLRYYDNGNYTEVLNNKVQISQSDIGQELSSIGWNKDDGLLLHVNDDHLKAGKYSTTLTWYFENSL